MPRIAGHLQLPDGEDASLAARGGAVLTNDPELAERPTLPSHRPDPRPFYEFHRVASNLRMTEFQGAILPVAALPPGEQTARRERNATYLARGPSEIPASTRSSAIPE